MDWLNTLGSVGNFTANLSAKAVTFIANLGVKTNLTTAKIINILFISILIYIFIKLISSLRPFIKWVIVILLFILLGSTIVSFFV